MSDNENLKRDLEAFDNVLKRTIQQNMLLEHEKEIEVSSGLVKGKLHINKFICPGVNVPCIMVQDVLCTPREFLQMAGKGYTKDWKGCIKFKETTIRRAMDKGRLDFTAHNVICGGRCKSFSVDKSYQNKAFKPKFPTTLDSFAIMNTSQDVAANKEAPKTEQTECEKKAIKLFVELQRRKLLQAVFFSIINNLDLMNVNDIPLDFLTTFAPALSQAIVQLNLQSYVDELLRDYDQFRPI